MEAHAESAIKAGEEHSCLAVDRAVAPSLCLCQLVHASSFASSRSLLLWLLFSITIYSFLTSHSNDWFINNHQIYLHDHDFNYERQNT